MVSTPRELLGRVLSAQGLLVKGLPTIGPLAIGAVLGSSGPTGAWLLLAVSCGASTLLAAAPLLRDRSLIAAPAPSEPPAPHDTVGSAAS
jgi:hypothetical protein